MSYTQRAKSITKEEGDNGYWIASSPTGYRVGTNLRLIGIIESSFVDLSTLFSGLLLGSCKVAV